ncbi:SulP family inorganic anion transporter [Paracrocinitomix mangrovi]|uniref:SulP family inorganic anion transporter n=1 Tax=Paracrocinitomix mangrovi TaxID=2862509 RepID=UPI001C8E007B|nr:SulP family inorganic anion transporter [Paracrocinitomix mangrovi]UKN00647.1 SulP family inorganic anion transporter [Paracrocinitomix mangrovi]
MFELIRNHQKNFKNELFSGLTVALALVPEAVAFAFVAGVDPLIGLYGAFMMGIITSIFGGRPGMISGATGAMAVVMVSLVKEGNAHGDQGLQYLFITLLFVGLFQILAGVFKLGKFVRLIPHPVMMGFVNGLAIVIFTAQFGMFKEPVLDALGHKIPLEDGVGFKTQMIQGAELWTMIGLVALTMGIMIGLPKLTKKIPAALTAILVIAGVVIFSGMEVSTVGSFITDGLPDGKVGTIEGGLPQFQTGIFSGITFDIEFFRTILPYALILAAIGLIESLMTLNLIDELTQTRGNGNRECIAQGSANIVNGLFGGMGGCAMIGQSIININSGARGRLSGIIAAVTLLMFILFAGPLIEQVPIAALVGVMFMVVIGTFAWSSFRIMNKIPLTDAFVLVLVSTLTVIFDLAIAVFAGIIVSALVFSWENAKRIRARKHIKEDGTKVYEIWGPLFFGSVQTFMSKFTVAEDPDKVEIDFIESRVSDHSGIEAIFNLVKQYQAADKTIVLKHLSPDCVRILKKASKTFHSVIEEDIDDPRYYVVTDLIEAED